MYSLGVFDLDTIDEKSRIVLTVRVIQSEFVIFVSVQSEQRVGKFRATGILSRTGDFYDASARENRTSATVSRSPTGSGSSTCKC